LAATNTCKQSAVTFEVFVLWLCNHCYYTCDVIGIKMMHRNLPYYKGIRTKTCCEYKLHKNSLHTFRKWSITWSQFVLSSHLKHWLIHHSMAIYSSCECSAIKDGTPCLDSGSVKKTSCRSSSLHTK